MTLEDRPPRAITARTRGGGEWGDACSLGTHYAPNGLAIGTNATLTPEGLLSTTCTRCSVRLFFRACVACARWIRTNQPHPPEACALPSPVTARGDDLRAGRMAWHDRLRAGLARVAQRRRGELQPGRTADADRDG